MPHITAACRFMPFENVLSRFFSGSFSVEYSFSQSSSEKLP